MPRTAIFTNFEPVHVSRDRRFTQQRPNFLHNARFSLGDELGAGGYGVAFRFNDDRYAHHDLVAKLPNPLLRRPPPRNRPSDTQYIDEYIRRTHNADTRNRAVRSFDTECRNAELILDPPELGRLDPRRRPGQGYAHLTANEYHRLMRATREWRAQPGYSHLHRVVHYDASIPMLLSRRADGSLWELRQRWRSAFNPLHAHTPDEDLADPPLWRDLLGRQLGAAVAFILVHTPIAHVDIKPSNILYKQLDLGVYNLQLADYGLCYPKNNLAETFQSRRGGRSFWGTTPYTPPVDAKGWSNAPQYVAPLPPQPPPPPPPPPPWTCGR